MGKALLAYFEPGRLTAYLKSTSREKFTPATNTGAAELLAEMSRIRRDGVARSIGERVRAASALAAPIFAGDGSVVAALLIAGPSERMRANAKSNDRLLKNAAAESRMRATWPACNYNHGRQGAKSGTGRPTRS